jgi:hypothetical protein
MKPNSALWSVFSLALFAAPSLVGCASEEDDASQSEDDVRKRTKPKVGFAAVALGKAPWAAEHECEVVAGAGLLNLLPGEQKDVPAQASYSISLGIGEGPTTMLQEGEVLSAIPSAIKVRFNRALRWNGPDVVLADAYDRYPVQLSKMGMRLGSVGSAEVLVPNGTKLSNCVVGLPGTYSAYGFMMSKETARHGNLNGEKNPVVLKPSQVTMLNLEAVQYKVAFDEIDPEYPNPAGRLPDNFRIRIARPDGSSELYGESVHDLKAFKDAVLPKTVPVSIRNAPYVEASGVRTFTMNRLEFDHVSATRNGRTTKIPGWVTVARMSSVGGGIENVVASQETKTGLHVPDGTYRIETSAPGVTTQTEIISFP